MANFLIIPALLFSFNTFAQHHSTDKLTDTAEATTEALDYFRSNSTAADVADFKGLKSWPVSGGIKVKIYMKTRGDVEYACHRHSANEPFECHDSHLTKGFSPCITNTGPIKFPFDFNTFIYLSLKM